MAAISDKRVTDERVTCLRIFADASGEISHGRRRYLLCSRDSFSKTILHCGSRIASRRLGSTSANVPAGTHETDWHNPPQRLLVLWLTGEVEFETSDGNIRNSRRGVSCWLRIRRARATSPVILQRASSWCTWPSPSIKANHAVGTSTAGPNAKCRHVRSDGRHQG